MRPSARSRRLMRANRVNAAKTRARYHLKSRRARAACCLRFVIVVVVALSRRHSFDHPKVANNTLVQPRADDARCGRVFLFTFRVVGLTSARSSIVPRWPFVWLCNRGVKPVFFVALCTPNAPTTAARAVERRATRLVAAIFERRAAVGGSHFYASAAHFYLRQLCANDGKKHTQRRETRQRDRAWWRSARKAAFSARRGVQRADGVLLRRLLSFLQPHARARASL